MILLKQRKKIDMQDKNITRLLCIKVIILLYFTKRVDNTNFYDKLATILYCAKYIIMLKFK